MDVKSYFESISNECDSLKNRVRNFIGGTHWATDGEWKESVLRTLISRSLPSNYSVGRGFIVSENSNSKQIDVLIFDNTYPILYQDGDLVFITASSCRAMIEVKSTLNTTIFESALKKLASNALLVREELPDSQLFLGLFSYDLNTDLTQTYLEKLYTVADGNHHKVINHVTLGNSGFIKFWNNAPNNSQENFDTWQLYNVKNMAAGYFIHNLMTHLSKNNEINQNLWFPAEGKENFIVGRKKLCI